MVLAALFTVAKTWKQPKHPLMDKWREKTWYICRYNIYNEMLFSHKKKEILPFATTQMSLRGIMLTETSQKRKTNTARSHVQVEPKAENRKRDHICG